MVQKLITNNKMKLGGGTRTCGLLSDLLNLPQNTHNDSSASQKTTCKITINKDILVTARLQYSTIFIFPCQTYLTQPLTDTRLQKKSIFSHHNGWKTPTCCDVKKKTSSLTQQQGMLLRMNTCMYLHPHHQTNTHILASAGNWGHS